MTRLTRRTFLAAAATTGAAAALKPWELLDAYAQVGPTPPFDHVVVLMMENRSFDHFLGWLPGANGRQSGLAYVANDGSLYPTYDLRNDFQGCGYQDPDHSWHGFLKQYNGGRLDGFLSTSMRANDTFPIGFYSESQVPVIGALAREYTTSDNYFASIAAETYPNRFYQHCATTDRAVNTPSNQPAGYTAPMTTIWDRLSAAGLSGRYYFSDLPFTGLFGTRFLGITRPVEEFLVDCAAGTLANVSFVDPEFVGENPQGVSRDDHPHADIRAGEWFIEQIYNAVRTSPLWAKTILVINYDEWGGFYDHVVPPKVVDTTPHDPLAPGLDHRQLGFRVPCVVVSPFSRRGRIVQGGAPFDHTSVLKMIEWRWSLSPLTARDAHARNLAEMLDFTLQRTDTPAIPTVLPPATLECGSPTSVPASPPDRLDRSPGSSGGGPPGSSSVRRPTSATTPGLANTGLDDGSAAAAVAALGTVAVTAAAARLARRSEREEV